MEDTKRKCFIITPIGNEGDTINRETMGIVDVVIKPIAERHGYETSSAVDFSSGLITDKIIQAIYEADLVIANITGQNPNVMYELALAHAFKKQTIHILKKGEKVPFDITIYKYYNYIDDVKGSQELSKLLSELIADIAQDHEKVSNPVTAALTRYTVVEAAEQQVDYDGLLEAKLQPLKNDIQRLINLHDGETTFDNKLQLLLSDMYQATYLPNEDTKNNISRFNRLKNGETTYKYYDKFYSFLKNDEVFSRFRHNVETVDGTILKLNAKKQHSLFNKIMQSIVSENDYFAFDEIRKIAKRFDIDAEELAKVVEVTLDVKAI